MKLKYLIEKELSGGKWVTFKNGHRTYIGKDGEVETGELRGINLKDKKAIKSKYSKLTDSDK